MPAAVINALITRAFNSGDTAWTHCRPATLDTADRARLASALAEQIARVRAGANARVRHLWLAKRADPSIEHSEKDLRLLEAHLLENVGTPSAPAHITHLQGLVVEHLWYALMHTDNGVLGAPVRVEEPSWSVIDSGLDGLVIYRRQSELVFRLWELKWHGTDDPVRDTVSVACRQLKANALKYLARHAKVREHEPDPELRQLYVKMADMWIDADDRAGVGVGVATAADPDLERAFESVARLLRFEDDVQREGLVAEVPEFTAFAELVREELWRGL
jgi:hypothetical protein